METPTSIRCLALLLLAGCTGRAPAVVTEPPPAGAPADGLVDVGASSLHYHCVGKGSPVVVFDAGLGDDGSVWSRVQPEVGRFTRACVYDRAGRGRSTPPRARTNREMARQLHVLLVEAGIAGPYVLVGHSMGGVNVRLFETQHREEVVGMVLVDAVSDDQPERYWSLFPPERMIELRRGMQRVGELDFEAFKAGIDDMRVSSRSLGDKPLVVMTRGREQPPPWASQELAARMLSRWQELQTDLVDLSTNSVYVIARSSGHYIQRDDPRLVVAAVRAAVQAAQTRTRIDPRELTALLDPRRRK
jgi:pimeloyl-ACP methyl ester carboxylesterase